MKDVFIRVIILILTAISFSCENDKMKEKANGKRPNSDDDLTTKENFISPQLIKKPTVTYPPSIKSSNKKGKVIVKVSIGIDGKVYKARAVWSTDKGLEAWAESLAYQYVFEPVIIDHGKPIPVVVGIPIIFDPDIIESEKRE